VVLVLLALASLWYLKSTSLPRLYLCVYYEKLVLDYKKSLQRLATEYKSNVVIDLQANDAEVFVDM